MEYEVLAILGKRDNYDRFKKFARGLSKEAELVCKELGSYYRDTGRTEVDWESFSTWFTVARHPSMDKDTREIYLRIFENLHSTSFREEEVLPLVRSFVDRSTCEELTYVATKVADGDAKVSMVDIKALLERRDAEVGEISQTKRAEWGVAPLSSTSGRLRWRLKELNDSIGAIGEDLIVVGSRPDGGKTTFLASEVTHMATQLDADEIVKWYINEEAMNKVQWRIIQATLGWTQEDMESDWMHTWSEYTRAMGIKDKVDLVDCSGWTTKMVESDLRTHPKVGLIVIDQLRKVLGYNNKETSEASRQELLYQWARDQAKLIAPVITVHQADGSAEGERWITMEKLHGSKTGVQGEADAIITIGQDPDYPDQRFLYVPKNKLRGDDPTLRNGKFEVLLDKHRARFTSP